MKSITEIALEKYPPKGISDTQDWEHDQNAECRKAFIKGYEYAYHQVIKLVNPSFDDDMNELSNKIAENNSHILSCIKNK